MAYSFKYLLEKRKYIKHQQKCCRTTWNDHASTRN